MSYPTPQEAWDKVNELGSKRGAARHFDIAWTTFWELLAEFPEDPLVVEESVKQGKKIQRLQDTQRVERKSWREYARVENAVSTYAEEIAGILRGHTFGDPPAPAKPATPAETAIIVHWSDHHLNEQVQLKHNSYNWDVASKRLKKHVDAAKRYGEGQGTALVAFTADLINSDRRLDELMANATNRAQASVMAVDLYQQAIRDLQQDFDKVVVAGVSGNESRIPQDVGWTPEVASDNYDWTIFEHLRMLLEKQGIEFVQPADPSEVVVQIAGMNVLLLHGHGKVGKDVSRSVQQIKGQYASRGVHLDFIIWGHVHEARVADWYARSSSLVGPNDYSEKALGLSSRASQNLYMLNGDGGFDGIKVDLQETSGVTGYDLDERLASHHSKAADKSQPHETIVRVTV